MSQITLLGICMLCGLTVMKQSAAADAQSTEPTREPLQRLLESAQQLFALESLGLAVLEDFPGITVSPVSHYSSFFPDVHYSTTYSITSVPPGFSTEGASLVVASRLSPIQWASTVLELPIADRQSACLSETLLRKHFGTDYKQSRPTHTQFGQRESYGYKTAHLQVSFTFDWGCAERMQIVESISSSRQARIIPRKKPPSASIWRPTLGVILEKLVAMPSFDVESIARVLNARVISSAKTEWFTGDIKSRTNFSFSDDMTFSAGSLTFETRVSQRSTTNATFRMAIREPELRCIGEMDPIKLGATSVDINSESIQGYIGQDLRPTKDTYTYKMPQGVAIALTFVRKDCASWLVISREM